MTGFLNIFKEEGWSSARVVNVLKRLTHTPCGHMGTLDPLAVGVLPVGVGNATRLFNFFLEKEKTYTARFRFGVTSETLDREGTLVQGGRVPSEDEIGTALKKFCGDILQAPPKYSAVSVDGKRGYKRARAGEDFELPKRGVHVSSFRLIKRTDEDEFEFEIVCGGGTYIRSLARDLAAELNTAGLMSYLRRDKSGIFSAETAVHLDMLTPQNVEEFIIPTDSVLPYPKIERTDEKLYHGLSVDCDLADGLYTLYGADGFYGIARAQNGALRTEKKLC